MAPTRTTMTLTAVGRGAERSGVRRSRRDAVTPRIIGKARRQNE